MAICEATLEATREAMKRKLAGVVPDFEIGLKAELVFEINRLKRERGAVILGHNYMEPALFHTVPDILGDSLELARQAAETVCNPIVFCGVRFMAETAKILNPERTVLLPARRAGCSLAESITAEDVRELRRRYPGLPIVAYINTYAEVKAEVDLICTSGNAVRLVKALNNPAIVFIPDEYLAANTALETGRCLTVAERGNFPPLDAARGPQLIGWRGRCEVHERFTPDDVKNIRAQFPDALVLAHPECHPDVARAADYSGGTSGMLKFLRERPSRRFALLTECSMADNIIADNPEKAAIRLCSIRCQHMNEITLENVLESLRENREVIEVPDEVRTRARRSLDRMLEMS